MEPDNARFRSTLSTFYRAAADERIGLQSTDGPLHDLISIERAVKANGILSCISSDDLEEGPSQSLGYHPLNEALKGAIQLYNKSIDLSIDTPEPYSARARAFQTLADRLLGAFGILPSYQISCTKERKGDNYCDGNMTIGIIIRLVEEKPPGLTRKVQWLYSLAERDYGKTLEIDPSDAEGHLNLSHMKRQLGKLTEANSHLDKALSILNKAINIDRSDLKSHRSRADIFEETGNAKLALADLETVLTLSSTESEISVVNEKIKELKAAIKQ
jgi:tetratricopeptide (TPR) repeat protein